MFVPSAAATSHTYYSEIAYLQIFSSQLEIHFTCYKSVSAIPLIQKSRETTLDNPAVQILYQEHHFLCGVQEKNCSYL